MQRGLAALGILSALGCATVRSPSDAPALPAEISTELVRKPRPVTAAVSEPIVQAKTGPGQQPVEVVAPAGKPRAVGSQIAERAEELVGVTDLREVSTQVADDCTAVPRIAYQSVGIDLMGVEFRPGESGVAAIYRRARLAGALHKHTPRPGDLVFFRETYDRNRDGRRNDGLTHIGVVESVAPDGTVTFVHRGSHGVARAVMNLRHPKDHRADDGRPLNDYIRAKSAKVRGYLTGELFTSFASPDPMLTKPAVIARSGRAPRRSR